jgi:hypothetical protein
VEGLYTKGYTNTYRIFLNDSTENYKIAGLVFDYWTVSVRGAITKIQYYMRFRLNTFPTESCYVDLTFLGSASTTNGNPRVFWKTCDGISGYITLANGYIVGSTVVDTAPSGTSGQTTGAQ